LTLILVQSRIDIFRNFKMENFMAQQQSRPFTHRAYIFKSEGVRKGRRLGWWQEEGRARVEADGSLFVYLHSTPIGGFDGRIRCYGFDQQQPEPPPYLDMDAPQGGDEDESGEDESNL
jgi:hypothetical protein